MTGGGRSACIVYRINLDLRGKHRGNSPPPPPKCSTSPPKCVVIKCKMCLAKAKLHIPSPSSSFWWRKVPREALLSACEKRGTGNEVRLASELPPQGKDETLMKGDLVRSPRYNLRMSILA